MVNCSLCNVLDTTQGEIVSDFLVKSVIQTCIDLDHDEDCYYRQLNAKLSRKWKDDFGVIWVSHPKWTALYDEMVSSGGEPLISEEEMLEIMEELVPKQSEMI